MSKKFEQHEVVEIPEEHKESWGCDFAEECDEQCDWQINEVSHSVGVARGACQKHALEWAMNSQCLDCISKIEEKAASGKSSSTSKHH